MWRAFVSGLLPVGFLLGLLAAPAEAATLRIATRAAWEAAVGSFVSEDFESVPVQEAPLQGGTIPTTWFDVIVPENHGGIGVFDVDGSRVFVGDLHGCDACSIPGTDGNPYLIILEFHQPIEAFAVDLLYVEDDDEDITETIQINTAGAAFEVPTMTFLGITSDVPFTTVELRVTNESYWALFHLDRVSAVVPEPSTLLLVAAGLAGVAASRRRLRRSNPAR